MKTGGIAVPPLVATVVAASAVALAATAYADDDANEFQSPSGNILCGVGTLADGKASATCEIRGHSYVPPQPKPPNCHMGWGDRISLEQGNAPVLHCHGDTIFGAVPEPPALPYGESRSAGTISCDSEPVGMTCTDSSSGHYFRISRDSLELG